MIQRMTIQPCPSAARYRWSTVCLFLAANLLACTLVRAEVPACQIVIGACHRAPLSTDSGSGILDRVVIEAFRRIGYAACIEQQTCERSLRNANQGITDGDLLRIPSAVASSAPHLLAVPEVLYAVPMTAFSRDPALSVKQLDDLAPWRVGYIVGWKILEERVRARTVLGARGPEELFTLLAQDKADLVIYERITGEQTIRNLGLRGIRTLEPPLLLTPQHLMLHRRHQALIEPLAAALRAIKADGSYPALFKQHGVGAPPGD
jgi:polar amino acid transport system substrate-binding protein